MIVTTAIFGYVIWLFASKMDRHDDDSTELDCISEIQLAKNVYRIKGIGSQCWFIDNYAEEPTAVDAEYFLLDASTDKLGALYTWDAAMNGEMVEGSQGICPDGWHIPTKADFLELIENVPHRVEFDDSSGMRLNLIGNDEFHLLTIATGRPSKDHSSDVELIENFGGMITSTELDDGTDGYFGVGTNYEDGHLAIGGVSKTLAKSVRCVRN